MMFPLWWQFGSGGAGLDPASGGGAGSSVTQWVAAIGTVAGPTWTDSTPVEPFRIITQ